MGTFHYPIILHSADGKQTEKIDALVDTGATYTRIPDNILTSLGYQAILKRRLKLASGSIIERPAGIAQIEIDGVQLPSVVIYGDPNSDPLLGAVTMEEFSVAPDPMGQRLIPVVALLMTFLKDSEN